jgi:hypothetical protein
MFKPLMNARILFGGVIVVTTLVTLAVLIVGLNENAYSQMLAPSYQLPQSKQVGGKYVNPNFGFEIVFPQGYSGYETSGMGYAEVVVSLGNPGTAGTASISLVMSDYGAGLQSVPGNNSTGALNVNPTGQSEIPCQLSSGCVKIGGKNAQVYSSESSMGGYYIKSSSYSVMVDPYKTIQLTYQAASPQGYDSNLAKFEESLKTIKFTK